MQSTGTWTLSVSGRGSGAGTDHGRGRPYPQNGQEDLGDAKASLDLSREAASREKGDIAAQQFSQKGQGTSQAPPDGRGGAQGSACQQRDVPLRMDVQPDGGLDGGGGRAEGIAAAVGIAGRVRGSQEEGDLRHMRPHRREVGNSVIASTGKRAPDRLAQSVVSRWEDVEGCVDALIPHGRGSRALALN